MNHLTDDHSPVRPGWTCRATGGLWPCTTARTALLVMFDGDRRGLILHLGAQLADAIDDYAAQNSGSIPPGLAERIMGWALALPE
ncbi:MULTISPECIES: flavin reductase [unclassified Micromonospora]|uniref:flavin reductase n=1 Tax=unclassified Micromonospora TaxID=2617518 RepID=UPI0022BC924F|nr:flavin reductase [Micromonospora sp. AKA38]GHJ14027.1 hypothetical protein TPA0908_20220 [Micromonospora sp. AKA38]